MPDDLFQRFYRRGFSKVLVLIHFIGPAILAVSIAFFLKSPGPRGGPACFGFIGLLITIGSQYYGIGLLRGAQEDYWETWLVLSQVAGPIGGIFVGAVIYFQLPAPADSASVPDDAVLVVYAEDSFDVHAGPDAPRHVDKGYRERYQYEQILMPEMAPAARAITLDELKMKIDQKFSEEPPDIILQLRMGALIEWAENSQKEHFYYQSEHEATAGQGTSPP
ncbi:MAG: hypothetical protein O7H41_00590 [Planctomycetota bacterium]|nr:hypothetical protein [Planctomycetota bacterium]